MSKIAIEWLTDEHDCETCGPSWANGAIVTIDGKLALELLPSAYCYDSTEYEEADVFRRILAHLGHSLEEDNAA